MAEPLLKVLLPITLTNSNDGQTRAWFKTAKARKESEAVLRRLNLVREPFDQPVLVVVTRVLAKGQRLWDSSSGLRGNYKQIEDSLVACGWFHDDGPNYITETRFRQDTERRDRPGVELEVWPASAV